MYVLEDYASQVCAECQLMLPLSWKEDQLHSWRFLVVSVCAGKLLIAPKVTTGEVYLLSYDVENRTLKKVQVCGLRKSLLSSVIIPCALIGFVHSILAFSEVCS